MNRYDDPPLEDDPTYDEENDELDPPMEQEMIRELFPDEYVDPDEDAR